MAKLAIGQSQTGFLSRIAAQRLAAAEGLWPVKAKRGQSIEWDELAEVSRAILTQIRLDDT